MNQKYHVVAVNLRTGGRYQLTDEPVGYDEANEKAKGIIINKMGSTMFDPVKISVEALK